MKVWRSNNRISVVTEFEKLKAEMMIDIKNLIEDYLGAPAPEDWNTNPNYRINLYDAEQLIQQALQKYDCYAALELLQQMYNESTELAKQGFESWQELQMNSDTENALLRVMRLIKKRQANAV